MEKVPKAGQPYTLPDDMRDVESSPAKKPRIKLIRDDIKKLKKEFKEHKMEEYIDVYRDSYAMLKQIYYFSKYIDPLVLKRMKKWITDFNHANHALNEIRRK